MPDRIVLDHVAHVAEHHRDLLPRYAGDLGGLYVGHGEAIGFSPMQLRFANDAKVELLRPHREDRNPFLRRYLDRRGPGLHHATFKVPDIRATIASLEAAGYAVVDVDLSQPDWQEAFVHPKSAHGFLVQIAQVRGSMPDREPPDWFPAPSAGRAASILRLVLCVTSVEAGLGLYRDQLGGEVVAGGPDWVDLDHGGGQLVRLQEADEEGASHLEVAVADPSSFPGAVERPEGRWEVPATANNGARLVVVDDLTVQAEAAWRLAPTRCAPTGCAWYHRVWPSLRALGLVAAPHRHAEFFRQALADAAGRVLVTGAADAAMVEIVADALPDAAITVLDRCATPVGLASNWAQRHARQVDPVVDDVLAYDGAGRYDAVVTHGLFSLVARDDRAELGRRWAGALRPGGRLVTTSSIAAPGTPDPFGFTDEAAAAFVARARALGAPEDVAAAAGIWARTAAVHPVYSEAEVRELLDGAGFDVSIRTREVAGTLGASAAGPTSARTATYLEIVAIRR